MGLGTLRGTVTRSQAGLEAVPLFVLASLVVALVGCFVALAYWRRWEWTGLPAAHGVGENGAVDRPAKTLWDWLQLLGIPVVLATLAFLLNDAQSSRELQRDDQRAAQQRRRAADAERENTLRTYFAQMSDLMLDRRLLRSKPGADVRKVARTATLTAVRRLDGLRRGLVVQFLAEARLLRRLKGHSAVVRVVSADLRSARLNGASVAVADLHGVDLRGADLSQADLLGANLNGANLVGANLVGTNLGQADVIGADLRRANLSDANPIEADLYGANLVGANLVGANLSGANLRRANLKGADLRGALLFRSDLREARGVDTTGSLRKPPGGLKLPLPRGRRQPRLPHGP